MHSRRGLKFRALSIFDSSQGWIAAALIGFITACVAFLVDVAVATLSDWKLGYCSWAIFSNREGCCIATSSPGVTIASVHECQHWRMWTTGRWTAFSIYVSLALAFGICSSGVTILTKRSLPVAAPGRGDGHGDVKGGEHGKTMYMAAGSGIPEIKTILSGFVIPHFLDFKVLVVKAVGAVFAVSSGMCLGKEGPFVHIATCVGWLVGKRFPKYNENDREMRELLSAACSSGLSVAFGAPIGGVLFSYEVRSGRCSEVRRPLTGTLQEISTYFPRKVLWRAFLCSLVAAIVLKELNPTGTGKLVLFETNYGISYDITHYLVCVFLGVVGGIFGGIFCKANFAWSKHFRKFSIIKDHPMLEVFLVVLVTSILQYPNPLTREPGDVVIKKLMVDCRASNTSWVCRMEAGEDRKGYAGWLAYGTAVKLVLMTVTFGCKVPSGIIIPALDAGALFGRLVGQIISDVSPGMFAMVGAAAFLAGVSRMTISLAVIMFELTGEIEYVVANMIAIMVAKWIADALEKDGVYDLAQTVLGHPYLDLDHANMLVKRDPALAAILIPPRQTMKEITVETRGSVPRKVLEDKLERLKSRGIRDAGLVLVNNGMLQGYLSQTEVDFGLSSLELEDDVELLGEGGLSMFVDRTPMTVFSTAPMEYVVEMFGKLGLRYLCVVEEGTSRLVGVILKKRLVKWLEGLKEQTSHGSSDWVDTPAS